MTITLGFSEQNLSARSRSRLTRHLEHTRAAVIDLLHLDEGLRSRPILIRAHLPHDAGGTDHHHAADHLVSNLIGERMEGETAERPSFSSHDGDLIVRVPQAFQSPAIIERLMVGQLLHIGLEIDAEISIRFMLDGVLGALQAPKPDRHKRSRVDLPLLSFLASRGLDGQPRSLQPFLSGHCKPEERRIYLAAATSFVTFLIKHFKKEQVAVFARTLKPASPNDACETAFGKSFHALQGEWDSWAHAAQGRPLGVVGFFVKGLQLYARERRDAAIVAASMVPQLAYTLAMPVGLSILFDGGILKHNASVITITLIWLAAGYFVSAIGGLAQDYCSSIAAAKAMVWLREKMFVKTQQLSDEVLQQTESGQLTSTFSSDLMLIETVLTRVLPNLLFRVVLLFGSAIIAFWMDWQMALASVVCLPLAFLAPRPLARIATRAAYERKAEDATLAGLVQENVVLSRPIRMFQLQDNRISAFRKVLGLLEKKTERANVFSAFAGRFTVIGASFVQLLVIGMGAVLSVHGYISAGVVIAFIGLLLNMGGAIAVMADAIPLLIQSVGAWQRVEMLLDAEISHEAEAAIAPGGWNGVNHSVAFQNVTFRFNGGEPVVNDASFTIAMGQSVAFVGPSGSGKSTLLNLIQRHIDAADGTILMDGTPIVTIAGADLRRRMATVAQDNPLFNMTVRENLRMGRLDATDAEIVAAAQAAEIDEGIRQMPQGYDTVVGEGGGHMSGGQRQRIAIARALLRDPSVLILDEATSALDPATQNAINATLAKLRPGRMTLAVTHHLQEAAEMDKIIVMKNGQVAEIGTHAGLLAKQGVYAEMWKNHSGLTLSDDGTSASITNDRLRAIPIFAKLPEPVLDAIGKAMHAERVEAGQILLREGKRPDRFHILVRGTVEMSVRGVDGRPVATRQLEKGDVFGDFALLQDMPQIDTATAMTTCSFLTLRYTPFAHAFGDDLALLAETQARIRERLQLKVERLVDDRLEAAGSREAVPELV